MQKFYTEENFFCAFCNFFAILLQYFCNFFAKILCKNFFKKRKELTNTDTFFSWVPVRRSVTGILNFVAHFWFESVLQCSNFLHFYRIFCTFIEFSALLYVYRHANLCSGLRAILSPQFIKKYSQFLERFPRRGSIQGPLGPSNLEATMLLTELRGLLKTSGQNWNYILGIYYVYH